MTGEELRALRNETKLSQCACADYMKISERTWQRWEKNGLSDSKADHVILVLEKLKSGGSDE